MRAPFRMAQIPDFPLGLLVCTTMFALCLSAASSQHCARTLTGEKGTGKSGKPLHFKGSTFHRVINGTTCACVADLIWLMHGTSKGLTTYVVPLSDFMCQGGDFTAHNGTGGEVC